MDCLVCGQAASYNRAVVDVVRDQLVGSICVECEDVEFGHVLRRHAIETETCLLCPRDGLIALPEWEAEPRTEDGVKIVESVYHVDAETPRLCGEHLQELQANHHRPETTRIDVRWDAGG